MRKKQRIAQSAFVSIGLLLFFLTYLYYPNLYKDKSFTDKFLKKDYEKTTQEDQITTFENMEYKGLYDFDKYSSIIPPFELKAIPLIVSPFFPYIIVFMCLSATKFESITCKFSITNLGSLLPEPKGANFSISE